MNAIEEMGRDARKNYDRLRMMFREAGKDAAKVLSGVLGGSQKRN